MTAASSSSVWRVTGAPLVPALADGPLAGITLAVKDLFAVAGHRLGAGVPAWLHESRPEPAHAAVVETLLHAGAQITGIAQTDEFAFSLSGTNVHYGSPPNPADPAVVVGGSSSGPASAAAQRVVRVGLGTDTGGSIRVPASYTGLHGLRTTHGLVPMGGVAPLAPSFDTVGWLAADVADVAAVARVLLPAAAPLTELRLAEDLLELADADCREVLRRRAGALAEASGLPLRSARLFSPEVLTGWLDAFRRVQATEAWALRGAWIEAHPGALGPGIEERFRAGQDVPAEQVDAARATIAEARDWIREHVGPGVGVLLPAASSPAPPIRVDPERKAQLRGATLRLTCVAGIGGLPCAVLPAGSCAGLPIGLGILGAPGSDAALVELAATSDR